MNLRRRTFLIGLGAFAAMPGASLGRHQAEAELVGRLKTLIHNRKSALVVGAAVLQCCSSSRTRTRVIRELVEGNEQFLLARSGKSLARCLRTAVSRDFERGRIVRVQGLVLAKTEASLCALIALDAMERA